MASTRARTVGVILAGGESSRFGGEPKGLATVDGRRIVDRVMDALRGATQEQLLVANDPRASEWLPGVRVVADVTPKAGPLGGLQAALHAADAPVLVVAWDMPFVTTALLKVLVERGQQTGAIVVPESEPGRAEPACAWYPIECREALDAFLARGERKPSVFLQEFGRVERVTAESLRALGDPARLLASVNSPDDLRGTNFRE